MRDSYTDIYGLLAQAVEHLTFNQGVAGSSPAWLSMASKINLEAFLFTKDQKKNACLRLLFWLVFLYNNRGQSV